MDKELKAKWVEALRSGEYKQTVGMLRRTGADDFYYCCIGVLLNVAGRVCAGSTIRSIDQAELKLADDKRIKLENMNDGVNNHRRHSFPEIADWIEANL